jgi:hypothetical protein
VRTRAILTVVATAAVLTVAVGACSSSSKAPSSAAAAAPTTTPPPTQGVTTTVAPAGSAAPTTTTAPDATPAPSTTTAPDTTLAPPPQTETVTPDTGLTDQQVVHVVAKGYTPGNNYAAVECADKGTSTAPGDCDLEVIKVASADPTGTVTIDFPAQKGPFGTNKIVCSAAMKCLISVESSGEANGTEVATEDISFAS